MLGMYSVNCNLCPVNDKCAHDKVLNDRGECFVYMCGRPYEHYKPLRKLDRLHTDSAKEKIHAGRVVDHRFNLAYRGGG